MDQSALDKVVARSELQQLAARYARAIDRRDRALLLSCYHEDAIDDHGTMFAGPAAQFVDWQVEAVAPYTVTAHYILNSLYEIDGDHGEGELYFVAYYRSHEPAAADGMMAGRYLDRYARRQSQWRIAHRQLIWDWVKQFPADAAQPSTLLQMGRVGQAAQDDSFAALPLLAALTKT